MTFTFATLEDVPQIRRLVNAAYKELSDMGLNYTGTYQDEAQTANRMKSGVTILAWDGPDLIGTVQVREYNCTNAKRAAYVSQFAVRPDRKRQGLGSRLMDFVEDLAKREKFQCLQLDTAKPATHLVSFYERRGYRIISQTRYEGKTYESWIFEKDIDYSFDAGLVPSGPNLL